MSLIDQALKAAQREKSRLDAESGRPSAPVLIRLRSQPRHGIERDQLLVGLGIVATIVAAVLWVRSTRETSLPDVPPVTSTILTEAIASDSVSLQGGATDRTLPVPGDSVRVPASLPRTAETHVADDGSTALGSEPQPSEPQPSEPLAENAPSRPAGTLRISVEQPRNATASQLFAEAIDAHRAQDYARAKQLYERVLAMTPSDADALNNLGVILSMEGEHDRAHALLRRAVIVAPRNAGAWNNIGNLLREQGEADEAIVAFRRALAIDPRHHGASVGLAQQYLATNALPEARTLLEDVLRTNPSLAEAHYTMGQVLELQGDRVAAVAAYGAFIRFAPGRLATHVELVRRRIELLSAGQ